MGKPRFQISLSLNEEDNARVEFLKSKDFKNIDIYRRGVESLEKEIMEEKNSKSKKNS